jgi:hypothetical protein
MANYYGYTGVGGLNNGTQFPSSGIITNAEKVIAMTALTDGRVGNQGGVLITADIVFGISTCTFATILCRQSTLGTSAVTGNPVLSGGNTGIGTYTASIGTTAATYPVNSFGVQTFQWVDYTGTNPIPAYQITGSTAAGTATILSAFVNIQPLGA